MVVLLQFPNESAEFRAERTEAMDGFRHLCRMPVIRQYGLEAEDLGLYVANCEHCGHITARLHAMPDIPRDLDIVSFEEELRVRALDPRFGWVPPHCPECGELEPKPISAIYGRYLPEIQKDLQVMLVRGGDRIVDVDYWLMDSDGESRQFEKPQDCMGFADEVGIPLCLRSLWRSFIMEHTYSAAISVYQVQPGYFIGLRPFAESDDDVDRMAQPFFQWIESMQAEGGYDVIAYLRDLEDDDLPITYADSYHTWLAGFASEIKRAAIDPFLFVDSDSFVQALDRHAGNYGLSAERDSDKDTLFVKISGGEIEARINVAPLLFRTIHEGLTFEQGIRSYFHEELKALSVTAEVVPLVRAALPDYEVSVQRGHYIDVVDDEGESTGFADAVRIATAYDPRNHAEFIKLIGELAPDAVPVAVTLGVPTAGHLAPVIVRKTA